MKTKQQKQKDLDNLAEQFKQANAAMLVSFKKMTVAKDQELRRQLREAGVTYSVVKNTLARKAAAKLVGEGFDCAVINPRFTKPLDEGTHDHPTDDIDPRFEALRGFSAASDEERGS